MTVTPRPGLKRPESSLRALSQGQADQIRELYEQGENGVQISLAELRRRFKKADGTMVSRQTIWHILQGKTYRSETPENGAAEGSENG